jgi:integrase
MEGCKRTKIQAVKRAINYAVEARLIPANPIKGYKTPKVNSRATYIPPEQEKAMLEDAPAAFATAIRVLIRTGARPGREFAALTAAHVKDNGDNKMEWVFAAKESKNKRPRVIRITDPAVIAIVRRQMERYETGALFRNARGTPWTRKALTHAFDRLRERLEKKGIKLDRDACLYSSRHTYAKRTLQGYWSGKATNIETLARLMGNTPEVCREHYLQWCDHYTEPLWEAC